MRVIGGSAKGQRLTSLPGDNTRPTMDRVKESIFNMIQLHVPDAVVLDLFAGSGALGVEALSRGGKYCYFVDDFRGSFQVINENLTKTKLSPKAKVLLMDFRRGLKNLEHASVDLIFLDPPYQKEFLPEALELIEKDGLLAPGGLIVIEQDKKETLTVPATGFVLWKEKKYGNTVVRILKAAEQ